MGEISSSICVIGSPDMDAMLSNSLPSFDEIKKNYEIPFNKFAISLFHPVTTEYENMDVYAANYVEALLKSSKNYIVIYPNNDKGSEFILRKLNLLENNERFITFPSVRFEAFLVMMKYAEFIIGNSSAGIREAPYYGIPTINIGTRQSGRSKNRDIINVGYSTNEISDGILKTKDVFLKPQQLFGDGKSNAKFLEILSSKNFWNIPKQKIFEDK